MKRVVGILGLVVLLAAPAFAGGPLWYTRDDFLRLCGLAGHCGLEQAFIDADREERAKIMRGLVEAIDARRKEQAAQQAAQEAERKRDLIIQMEQQQRERQHQETLRMEREKLRVEQQKLEELRAPKTTQCSSWSNSTTCREYKDQPAIQYQPR